MKIVGDSPEPEGKNARRHESKKVPKTNRPLTPPKVEKEAPVTSRRMTKSQSPGKLP
jgi:hypothetical protein